MHCKACEMLIRDILEEEDIEVISVSQNSILVIDEPEMHLHKSITKILILFILE